MIAWLYQHPAVTLLSVIGALAFGPAIAGEVLGRLVNGRESEGPSNRPNTGLGQ